MQDHLDFLIDDAPPDEAGGIRIPWSVVVSIVFHVIFITWVVRNYRPIAQTAQEPTQMMQYVELMRQSPKDFTQAPGAKTDKAPLSAPLSDANRKAAMPKPNGDQPTPRPGDGSPLYVPRN